MESFQVLSNIILKLQIKYKIARFAPFLKINLQHVINSKETRYGIISFNANHLLIALRYS
jgi:hypothetical protein